MSVYWASKQWLDYTEWWVCMLNAAHLSLLKMEQLCGSLGLVFSDPWAGSRYHFSFLPVGQPASWVTVAPTFFVCPYVVSSLFPRVVLEPTKKQRRKQGMLFSVICQAAWCHSQFLSFKTVLLGFTHRWLSKGTEMHSSWSRRRAQCLGGNNLPIRDKIDKSQWSLAELSYRGVSECSDNNLLIFGGYGLNFALKRIRP